VSAFSLMTSSFKFFDSNNFTAQGQVHQRRSLMGIGLFLLCIVLMFGAGLAAGTF